MNSMSIKEFAKLSGWNEEKIRNFLRERVLPYEKSNGKTYIIIDEISDDIKSCFGGLTTKAWKRLIPELPPYLLLDIFKERNVKSCGMIRKQKYYLKEDILSALVEPLSDHEQIIVEALRR